MICFLFDFFLFFIFVFWDDGFPPQALIYIYISFQCEETYEDLINVSPFY